MTLSMDLDGRPDEGAVSEVLHAANHLALRIEYLEGRSPRTNPRVRRRLKKTLAAYRALDDLMKLDDEDRNHGP